MIFCTFEKGYHASLRHVVVHALVEKDGAILLEKRAATIIEGGKWGMPSGFLSRDETAVGGVLRELKEETGWVGEVQGLFRINSRPDRPHEDRQNVAITFLVGAIQEEGKPDEESTEIRWFPIRDLPPLETLAFDHGETIGLYLKHKNFPLTLPLFD